jgi:hypothetical protein
MLSPATLANAPFSLNFSSTTDKKIKKNSFVFFAALFFQKKNRWAVGG